MKLINLFKILIFLLSVNKKLFCIEIKRLSINGNDNKDSEYIVQSNQNTKEIKKTLISLLHIIPTRISLINSRPAIQLGNNRIKLNKDINLIGMLRIHKININSPNKFHLDIGIELEYKRWSGILLHNDKKVMKTYGGIAYKASKEINVVIAGNLEKKIVGYTEIRIIDLLRIELGRLKTDVTKWISNLTIKVTKNIEITINIQKDIKCSNLEIAIKNNEGSNISRLSELLGNTQNTGTKKDITLVKIEPVQVVTIQPEENVARSEENNSVNSTLDALPCIGEELAGGIEVPSYSGVPQTEDNTRPIDETLPRQVNAIEPKENEERSEENNSDNTLLEDTIITFPDMEEYAQLINEMGGLSDESLHHILTTSLKKAKVTSNDKKHIIDLSIKDIVFIL